MHERQTTQTQTQDRGRGEFDRPDDRSMTRSRSEMDQGARNEGGDWTGYVVPYRYYGPGYRGVGYYSVMYQGAEGSDQGQHDEPSRYGAGQGHWGKGAQWGEGTQRGEGPSWGVQPTRGYAGRGPKGYKRSDDRLREEISDRLMADDSIDASEIQVGVKDGEATLTGTVEDRWSKRHAEDIAERVMGVRDVMNQLRVDESFWAGGKTNQQGDRSYQEATSSSTGVNGKRGTPTGTR